MAHQVKMVYSFDDDSSVVFTAEDSTGDAEGVRDVRLSFQKWLDLEEPGALTVTIEVADAEE